MTNHSLLLSNVIYATQWDKCSRSDMGQGHVSSQCSGPSKVLYAMGAGKFYVKAVPRTVQVLLSFDWNFLLSRWLAHRGCLELGKTGSRGGQYDERYR